MKSQHPGSFSGVALYFTSGIHSVRSENGNLSTAALVEMMANILEQQLRIIQEEGGWLEQFVGDCVCAYWLPADPADILDAASRAAGRIVKEKVVVPGLDFRMAVRFCAADLAGANFGSPTRFQFQVIGRARSRAISLPGGLPGRDNVFTDAESYAAMVADTQLRFERHEPNVYSMRLK